MAPMISKPIKTDEKLLELLERAKSLPPMTKGELEVQRRSWVVGEMMLSNPEMTKEEANRIYDEVTMRTKTLSVCESDYGPEETEALRAEVIELRDGALKQGNMEWSVKLSHVVALLAALKQEVWPDAV